MNSNELARSLNVTYEKSFIMCFGFHHYPVVVFFFLQTCRVIIAPRQAHESSYLHRLMSHSYRK